MVNRLGIFLKSRKEFLISFFCGLLLLSCVMPNFLYYYSISKQIAVTLLLSACAAYIMFLLKIKIEFIGRGLKYCVIMCLIITVVFQVITQIKYVSFGYSIVLWRYIFYFDRPFDVALLLLAFVLPITLFRLFYKGKNDSELWHCAFDSFFKEAMKGLSVLYIFSLIFGLFLNREKQISVDCNFVPLKTVFFYLNSPESYAFENVFMFIGNALMFLPLGFYLSLKMSRIEKIKKIIIIILLPVFLSCAVEFSQYLFKNGNVDIDDVILNSFGFYLGCFGKYVFDFVRKKVTDGAEKTIFRF